MSELRTLFKGSMSKFNVPFFQADSEAEKKFVQFCRSRGWNIRRQTLFEYDGRDNTNVEYLFLTLKDDRGRCISEHAPEFIDMTRACPEGESFGICNRGATQIGPVTLAPGAGGVVNELDLLVTSLPWVPKIYLLSGRLANVLIDAKPTGCEVVPCQGETSCFQLQIVGKTPHPVKVGNARISKQCPNCGSVKMMISSEARYFHAGDLLDADFQLCDWYETENAGRFFIPFGFPVVSRRIFDLLLDKDVKGLGRYCTDPPIRYAVVEIR